MVFHNDLDVENKVKSQEVKQIKEDPPLQKKEAPYHEQNNPSFIEKPFEISEHRHPLARDSPNLDNLPLNKAKTWANPCDEEKIIPLKRDAPTKVGSTKVRKKSKNTPMPPRRIRSQHSLTRQPIGCKNTKRSDSNRRN